MSVERTIFKKHCVKFELTKNLNSAKQQTKIINGNAYCVTA